MSTINLELKMRIKDWLENLAQQEKQQFISVLSQIKEEINAVLQKTTKIEKGLLPQRIDKAQKLNNEYVRVVHSAYERLLPIVNQLVAPTIGDMSYAIYYKDQDGKVLRIPIKELKAEALYSLGNGLGMSKTTFTQAYASEIEQARKQEEYQQAIQEHYSKLEQTIKNAKLKNFNKKKGKMTEERIRPSYIAEALERDLSLRHSKVLKNSLPASTLLQHDFTQEEAIQLYRSAQGKDAWYTGGDILTSLFNTSVKSFIGKENKFYTPIANITGHQTILNLIEYLLSALSFSSGNLTLEAEKLAQKLTQQSNVEQVIKKEIEKDGVKTVEKIIGKNTPIKVEL